MRRFLRKPSPATVIAVIALVAATSGNAVAHGVHAVIAKLSPNSVTSATVKDGSLQLKDFKASDRKKLVGPTGAAGASGPQGVQGIQGPPGTPDGYTKSDADAKFLGATAQASDSKALSGITSGGFIQGSGQSGEVVKQLAAGATQLGATLIDVPNLGSIFVECEAAGGDHGSVVIENPSATTTLSDVVTRLTNGAAPTVQTIAQTGGGREFDDYATAQYIIQMSFGSRVSSGSQISSTAAATVVVTDAIDTTANTCRFQASMVEAAHGGIGVPVGGGGGGLEP